MLKNIPDIISPELLKILHEMGHGDTIVISDGNFPAASVAKHNQLVRCDGHGTVELLDAILSLMPLDTYVEKPVGLMQVVEGDDCETPIWSEYEDIVIKYDDRGEECFRYIDRFDFYEEAKKAYAVVYTGERALYANIILQKGVL